MQSSPASGGRRPRAGAAARADTVGALAPITEDLDDGSLALADAPEAGPVAALHVESARLRAALDAR